MKLQETPTFQNSNLLFVETLRYLNDKMRSVSNQLVSAN